MNSDRRLLIGEFRRPRDIVSAAKEAKELGLTIRDIHSPFPVPELVEVMGLKRSRLPWVCLLLAIVGASFKVWFQFWTSSTDWPINVGGKPWNSLPAFLPVTFEFMVLFAGTSLVLAFLVTRKLFPGKKIKVPLPSSTNNRFVLVIEGGDTHFGPSAVREIFLRNGTSEITELWESQGVN